MKWLRALALLAALAPAPALANFTFSQGAGTTAFSFTGSGSCAGVQCFATAIINSSGTEIFTSANPAQVTGANGSFPITGTITANQGTAGGSAWLMNLGQMGGTSINSGCVGALSGFGATIPSTVCGVFGTYVINTLGPGPATPANSNPVTLGTSTPLKLSALTNAAVAIKASAGQFYMLHCGNSNAAQGYVQIFNLAAGSVVLGTTVPLLSVVIAPTSTGGFALAAPMAFSTAMSAAATTTAGGSTALGTALDCNVAFN